MTGPFTEIRGVKLLIEESSYIDWLIRSIIESTDSNRTISTKVIMMIINQWLEAELEASGSIGSEKKKPFLGECNPFLPSNYARGYNCIMIV